MPDPVEPPPPSPPPVPEPDALAKSNSTGLPSNVAAALACFPLIGGIIFYILEKNDRFVRFYAMQSIIFGGVWILFNIVSAIVHAIFWSHPGHRRFSRRPLDIGGALCASGFSGHPHYHDRESVHERSLGYSLHRPDRAKADRRGGLATKADGLRCKFVRPSSFTTISVRISS